jgi:hypothetical protein
MATATVSPGASTRAALRSSISTGRLVVARATAVARLEAGWASVVAGVATKARASAHRPAMVAVPGAAGCRVLWLDVLTAIGPAQLGTVAVGSVFKCTRTQRTAVTSNVA